MNLVATFIKAFNLTMMTFIIMTTLSLEKSYAQKHTLPYQTIIADKQGQPIKDLEVEVLVELIGYSANGAVIYSETHAKRTDLSGAVSLQIGAGLPESIDFSELNWSIPMYVTISFKPNGFINYFSNNTSELLSVPYAIFSLYSKCEEGCPGAQGPQGPEGDKGPQGFSGPPSSNGSTGPQGAMGPQGAPGNFQFTLESVLGFSPSENEVYLDDGTNRADSKPGLRIYLNNTWQDL